MISIVVPVYRNSASLRELRDRVNHTLEAHGDRELIFVDDASPDDSGVVLARLAREDASIVIVTLPRNVGQQAAVLAGLARARGDVIVIMDADLQDPPEAIAALLAALEPPLAAVFAGRRGDHDGAGRMVTSRLFKNVLHLLCGTPVDAGLFVAIDRRTRAALLDYQPPGPSVLAMIGCTGLPLGTIPCRRDRRPRGSSAYTWRARLSFGIRVLAWTARVKLGTAAHG